MANSVTLPMVVVSSQITGDDTYIFPSKLPSAGFKYSRWHELHNNKISSSELKYPRVRKVPNFLIKENYESLVFDGKEEDLEKIQDPSETNSHNTHENWKECKIVNLSYQNLGDKYQRSSFLSILKKLHNCEDIDISHNQLGDISNIMFGSCRNLNLQDNEIKSFKELPRIQRAIHVNLNDNNITKTDGIGKLKSVQSLSLLRNPIQYSISYRQRIFDLLPHLKVLDGIPKLQEDLK